MQECYEYKYEKANIVDYSKIDLIPFNDTDVFINGSLTFVRDVNAPFKINVYTEQYIQGQWLLQAFNRTFDDFCFSMKNPGEPFYTEMLSRPRCPYKKGVSP